MLRRNFVNRLALAVSSQALLGPMSFAQARWPARSIRLIVPYTAGGGPDVVARTLVESLSKDLKVSVFVENKGGANAIIGTSELHRAPPDGYTFLMLDRMSVTVNPLLYMPLPYDPKQMVSVTSVADDDLYLAVSTKLPVTDFKSFVELAKSRPGTVRFGTSGVGSIMHLNMELIQGGTGASFLHVPFKSVADTYTGVLSDQIDVLNPGAATLLPHVRSGALRLLAVGAQSRSAVFPDVPTIMEASGANLLLSTGYTIHAKVGTPPEIIARVNAAFTTVLNSPEIKRSFFERGLKPRPSTLAEVDALIKAQDETVGRLIRDRGIKVQ